LFQLIWLFFAVVAFLAAGLAAFFVAVFLAPPALAALVFFVLVCFVAFDFVAAADFVVALDFGFDDLVIITFFGLAAVVVDDVVVAAGVVAVVVAAELFVLAAVATFLAGFEPADFERERFFEPVDALVVDVFFVFGFFVVFFFAGVPSTNLNEPLAPLPFVCLKFLALTPFLRADLRC